MKHLTFLFFLLLISLDLFGVDFSVDGYYRTRGDWLKKLDLETGTTRSYIDQRLRLNSDLMINDNIDIFTQFDILDNAIYGENPAGLETATNPSYFTSTENSSTYSQDKDVSEKFYNNGTNPSILKVKRLWARVYTPVGYIKFGRQPSHFGLGLNENSGNGLDDNFGDSFDRISFETTLKSLSFSLGYDKEVEIDNQKEKSLKTIGIDNSGADVSKFFIKGGYVFNTNGYSVDGMISRKKRSIDQPDLVLWTFDLYSIYKKEWFRWLTEFVSYQGHGGKNKLDISAYNLATRLKGEFSEFEITTEFGFSTGTKNVGQNKENVNSVPFDKDYNISYFLFEEALPGGSGKDITNDSAPYATVSPSSGAVNNALYPRLNMKYRVIPEFYFISNMLLAWSWHKPQLGFTMVDDAPESKFSDSKFYGFEYSLGFGHDINEYLHYGLVWAQFFPGGIYDDQRSKIYSNVGGGADSTYGLQAFFNITF